MADPIARLRSVRDRGTKITQSHIDGAKNAVAAERAWVPELLRALEPWGEGAVGLFEPIGGATIDEDDAGRRHVALAGATDPERQESLYWHSVRMVRLNNFFAEVVAATSRMPKQKTGRPPIDDAALITRAREIVATQVRPNKTQAFWDAMEELPEEERLSAEEEETIFERVRKKL